MDTSDPYIEFDSKGVCNHCSSFENYRLKQTYLFQRLNGEKALNDLFRKVASNRRGNSRYDAVIGISGGVDSSLVALLAAEAGLKVLAVHMDNGWDTPVALRNVASLLKFVGCSYRSYVLNWSNFKEIQKAFVRSGVPDIELPTDISIQMALHSVACEHNVRTILSGGNIRSEGILPAAWQYNARDSYYAKNIVLSFATSECNYKEIDFNIWSEVKARFFNGIKTYYPLNYVNYKKSEAKCLLKEKFNWLDYGGKHCESVYTRFAQLIYLPRRHGIDYRRGYLSADVVLGSISRDSALKELETPAWAGLNVDADVDFVAQKLDIPSTEMYQLMKGKKFWYRDFPNREKLLGIIYDTYRFLYRKAKASNF